MTRSPLPPGQIGPGVRWLVWGIVLAVWTVGLLSPQPVDLADRMLTAQAGFLSFKAGHVAAYAVLAVLSGWLHVRPRHRWLLLALLSLHAFATEYCQRFVPPRTPSWGDVGLDHLGLLVGLGLSHRWWLGSD